MISYWLKMERESSIYEKAFKKFEKMLLNEYPKCITKKMWKSHLKNSIYTFSQVQMQFSTYHKWNIFIYLHMFS